MRTTTRIGLGSATVAMAAMMLLAVTGTAEAGRHGSRNNAQPHSTQRSMDLVRPTFGPDADASGVLRVRTSRHGEKGVLKLHGLDARTRYEVRDAATDEVLGSVRTNRRGRAKMKVRRRVRVAGKRAMFEIPDQIEVVRMDDDQRVLMGATDEAVLAELDDLPAFGFEHYEGAEGWQGAVDMLSFVARDTERFGLTLSSVPSDRGERGEVYDFVRGTTTGTALPLDVASVADLSGRAFRVLAGDGSVLLRGVLPDLKEPRLRMPPVFDMPDMGNGRFADWPEHMRNEDDNAVAKMGGMGMGMRGRGGMPDFGAMPGFDADHDDVDDEHMQRGDLEEFSDFFELMPPEFMPFRQPEREPSRLRLEIADGDGNLADVGNLDHLIVPDVDWSDVDWRNWDCPGFDDHDDDAMDDDDDRDDDGLMDDVSHN